ncbi:MAG: hypothetical protein NT105_17405 [Verrucomicrobia bacterium]|nr:hypothetical protein [Verrucomicrobiota bacterium]
MEKDNTAPVFAVGCGTTWLELGNADVFRQMTVAGVVACSRRLPDKEDSSFFFVRGAAAVRVFDKGLRAVTSRLQR